MSDMKNREVSASKRRARQRKQRNRRIAMTLCLLALVMVVSVGGTIAWLTAQTDPVVNTFTVGDINITLGESANLDLKMVPGKTITKDPKVTVKAGSEDCWLFVKVDEASWPAFAETDGTRKVNYSIANGWSALGDNTGVYYRSVTADATNDQVFQVLTNNQVTVSENLTKGEIKLITTNPTLTFTAYACQKDNVDTAAEAWAKLNPSTT